MKAIDNYTSPLRQSFKHTSHIVISLTLLSCLLFMGFRSWSYTRQINQDLHNVIKQLEYEFNEAVQYSSSIFRYILKNPSISIETDEDLSYIFRSLGDRKFSMLHWTGLLRSDENFQLRASNRMVQPDANYDLTTRSYLHNSKKYPYTIQVGEPVVGLLSGQWSVPFGMGFTDASDRYKGTLFTGFVIPSILKNLPKTLMTENIDLHITFHTTDILKKKLPALQDLTPLDLIKMTLQSDGDRIAMIHQMKNYPPILLISLKHQQLLRSLLYENSPYLLLILSFILVIAILITYTKRHVITPLENLAHDVDNIHYHYKLLNHISISSMLDRPKNEVRKIQSALLLTNYLLAQQQESNALIDRTKEALSDLVSSQLYILRKIRSSSKELHDKLKEFLEKPLQDNFLPTDIHTNLSHALQDAHHQHIMTQDAITMMKQYCDITKHERQEADIAYITYRFGNEFQTAFSHPIKVRSIGNMTQCYIFKQAMIETLKKAVDIMIYTLELDPTCDVPIVIETTTFADNANLLTIETTCNIQSSDYLESIQERFQTLEQDRTNTIQRSVYMLRMFSLINGGLVNFVGRDGLLSISIYFPNVVSNTRVIEKNYADTVDA